MVISETSAVAFMSSMKRLPQGGIIATTACGRMIRRSASMRLMLRAMVASHWPRGTASMAPRTTDRKSVVGVKSVAVRVYLGGGRINNKKKIHNHKQTTK